jgi:hypothetical protein
MAVRKPENRKQKTKVGSGSQTSRTNKRRTSENQLTFNLLPLRLEGLARILSRLPQAENRGLLLLEGLAQILMRNAELGQLPVELRYFFVPLLEGRLRPLECGALLLESALGLFPR